MLFRYFGYPPFVVFSQSQAIGLSKMYRIVFATFKVVNRSHPVSSDQSFAVGFQISVQVAIAFPALSCTVNLVPSGGRMPAG